jgi:hypothetical protein
MRRILIFVAIALGCAAAEPSGASAAGKEARRHFGQVGTRAVANFRSADMIDASLRAGGSTLHPQLVTLRIRIESYLDEAQAALDKNDFAAAEEAVKKAEGLLDRFAKRLGGD